MARYKGTFSVAANYEPHVGGPFDARELVEAKADLTNPATWRQHNGEEWLYVGMNVTVASDVNPKNNGTYRLSAFPYTDAANWIRQADVQDIAHLQEQIDNIEVTGGGSMIVELELESELPIVGDENTTYFIKENSSIQRWDDETGTYLSYGGDSDFEINIIHGGNSNGNEAD